MKVIFLDMDGVLCTPRASVASGDTGMMAYLDPIACLLLRKLVEKTGARLVISSTWRKYHTRESFASILSANCPNLGNYVVREDAWRTDDLGPRRGNEIARWLESRNDIEKFIILDDDSDMEHLMEHLILCNAYDGFGLQNYIDALEILGEKYAA